MIFVTAKGLGRHSVGILCRVAVDVRVTRPVDGTKFIHAMLPKSIVR